MHACRSGRGVACPARNTGSQHRRRAAAHENSDPSIGERACCMHTSMYLLNTYYYTCIMRTPMRTGRRERRQHTTTGCTRLGTRSWALSSSMQASSQLTNSHKSQCDVPSSVMLMAHGTWRYWPFRIQLSGVNRSPSSCPTLAERNVEDRRKRELMCS